MANIADKQIISGGINLVDAGFIVASKLTIEEAGMRIPFVGDGTMRSGLLKVGAAIAARLATKNKWVSYMAAGALIDGVEDVFTAARQGNFSLSQSNTKQNKSMVL